MEMVTLVTQEGNVIDLMLLRFVLSYIPPWYTSTINVLLFSPSHCAE